MLCEVGREFGVVWKVVGVMGFGGLGFWELL